MKNIVTVEMHMWDFQNFCEIGQLAELFKLDWKIELLFEKAGVAAVCF